jgi:hypothetical protein
MSNLISIQYKCHGHENAHVNLFFHIHVRGKEGGEIVIWTRDSYKEMSEVVNSKEVKLLKLKMK